MSLPVFVAGRCVHERVATAHCRACALACPRAAVAMTDEELRKYYDENASRYTAAEERRASHILINAAKEAKDDVKAAASALSDAISSTVNEVSDTVRSKMKS